MPETGIITAANIESCAAIIRSEMADGNANGTWGRSSIRAAERVVSLVLAAALQDRHGCRRDDLRAEIQRQRDDNDRMALEYGDLPDGDATSERCYGRVGMCDDLLAFMAHADETEG